MFTFLSDQQINTISNSTKNRFFVSFYSAGNVSQLDYTVLRWQDDQWDTNDDGFERKQSWPNQDTSPRAVVREN